MRAKLSRATIFTKDNVIVSKEPVVVDMPSGTIRSNEMTLHNKSREIDLHRRRQGAPRAAEAGRRSSRPPRRRRGAEAGEPAQRP